MAKYLNFDQSHPIDFLFLVERETNETIDANADSWWLDIGIETSEAGFAVEINDVFAVWLVDAMLERKNADGAPIRVLTASEIAVLEFLAANLTHEANRIISAPLFGLRGLSRENPALINQTNAHEKNLLVANWQTIHGSLNSIVKIYVAPETLKALDADENALLNAAPRREMRWNAVQNRVRDVRTRLFIGEVALTLADVAGLETGDVVLLGKYDFSVAGGELAGSARIFLGDGTAFEIVGAFVSSESASAFEERRGDADNEILVRRVKSNRVLRIAVERFEEPHDLRALEKSMLNEEIETTEPFAEDGGGIALENLAVTLRVELEARRLTLAEVGNLRINQIIELGIAAADPVNLLIDDKTVARGELVEVEDRLGVRIVQILR